MAKGQSWSMDLVIAVVIFGFIAVIFYSLLIIQQKPSIDDLQTRAQDLNQKLEQNIPGCGVIIQNQTLTPQQVACLYNLSYPQLKTQLGISGEFCIYIKDSQGRLYVVNTTNGSKNGFGSPQLVVSGQPCG